MCILIFNSFTKFSLLVNALTATAKKDLEVDAGTGANSVNQIPVITASAQTTTKNANSNAPATPAIPE